MEQYIQSQDYLRQKIEELRDKRRPRDQRYKLKELAEMIGIKQSTMYNFMSRQSNLSPEKANLLSDIVDTLY